MNHRKRGFVYALSLLTIFFLTVAGTSLLLRSVSELNVSERHRDLARAFQLAEAGIDDALVRLRDPVLGYWNSCGSESFETPEYRVECEKQEPLRKLSSTGTFTGRDSQVSSRQVEVQVRRFIPPNFYDNAIYGAGDVNLKGNAYLIDGEVLTGNTGSISNTENIQCANPPCLTQNATANPLPQLSFAELYQIALSQGNVYTAARLQDIRQHEDAFPTDFCWGGGEPPCTPNVNYVTTDLVLNGNIGTIGGFFVVVGSVITDPTMTEDTTINGNGQVAGVIYTTGDFTVNGGGNGFNVEGGVLVGDLARLNGNVTVGYYAPYMEAIKDLNINPDLQLLLWRECPQTGCPD